MSGKVYRAILIDPEKRSIETIASACTHEAVRELINAAALDHFRIADHGSSWDYGWIDDGGLSRGMPVHAFKFDIRRDPLAGRCVLVGVDKEGGDTVDAKFQIDILRANIEWLGVILPEVTWDETERGNRAIVTYSKVRGLN